MAGAQAGILAAGAAVLRPGGLLVYSTCTISPTENEHLIDAFLDSHRDFAVDDLSEELPRLRMPASYSGEAGPADRSRFAQTLPGRDGTAGFFIARLRRS